jgi:hypothetical protein
MLSSLSGLKTSNTIPQLLNEFARNDNREAENPSRTNGELRRFEQVLRCQSARQALLKFPAPHALPFWATTA